MGVFVETFSIWASLVEITPLEPILSTTSIDSDLILFTSMTLWLMALWAGKILFPVVFLILDSYAKLKGWINRISLTPGIYAHCGGNYSNYKAWTGAILGLKHTFMASFTLQVSLREASVPSLWLQKADHSTSLVTSCPQSNWLVPTLIIHVKNH